MYQVIGHLHLSRKNKSLWWALVSLAPVRRSAHPPSASPPETIRNRFKPFRAHARAQAGPKPGPKPGPSPGPSWAQAWAQARAHGPKLGASQKFGTPKIPKIKILKIKIRVAQNVGKVWISRKKNLLAPFGALPGNFLRGPKK